MESLTNTWEDEFPEIRRICDQHRGNAGSLLLVLQKIQDLYGHIPKASLPYIAKSLMITPSHLYGTMTFYKRFTLTPRRKYILKICRGTACELNKAPALLARIGEMFDLNREGEINHPLFSLEQSACLGECDKSPVVMINDTLYAHATPEMLEATVKEIMSHGGQAGDGRTKRNTSTTEHLRERKEQS